MIEQFLVSKEEADTVGLKEISLSRLGRVVALAGKNGAGKSRIFDLLKIYTDARNEGIGAIASWKDREASVKRQIAMGPDSANYQSFFDELPGLQAKISRSTGHVICGEQVGKIAIVPFVPKKLQLDDPERFMGHELTKRADSTSSTGGDKLADVCLFYIKRVQQQYWNTTHPDFSDSENEIDSICSHYGSLKEITKRLLGAEFGRNADGIPTLFGKPIADANLSDGQKILLQLAVSLHSRKGTLDNAVLLLDEPENHLHPSAVIDLLKAVFETSNNIQVWIATHSVPLLAYVAGMEPMALWYVDEGVIQHAGRRPEMVLRGLLGDDEQLGRLNTFTGLPSQLSQINYAAESLLPPAVHGSGREDPQIAQIRRLINVGIDGTPLTILDFGAGKGRLIEGLDAAIKEEELETTSIVDYYAYDVSAKDKEDCVDVIQSVYNRDKNRYFNCQSEFLSQCGEESISVVVMCNVFHEIAPSYWPEIFSGEGLLGRALKPDGYLMIVEDQKIPVGECAHDFGFILLDTDELKILFRVSESDVDKNLFSVSDARGNGRLKAHLIAKRLLINAGTQATNDALNAAKNAAMKHILTVRGEDPTYANGQLHGLWTQQFANISIYLDSVKDHPNNQQ